MAFWSHQRYILILLSSLLILAFWALLPSKRHQPLKPTAPSAPTETSSPQVDSKTVEACDKNFHRVIASLSTNYRQCLLGQLENKNVWQNLRPAISYCLGDGLWRLLDVKRLENRDDVKFVILPPENALVMNGRHEFLNCTEVTLGIGRDIESELLLRQLMPKCKFYGADPIKSSGTVFKELGQYFELAVADKAGVLKMSVMENGKYFDKNVDTVTLVDFLTNYVNATKIDYMLIDNEGPEYGIFGQLLQQGDVEKSGLSICQISAEFHYPLQNYGQNDMMVNELFTAVIRNSSFVPIWSDINYHTRSFYVNIEDPYCVGKYFRSKWCGYFDYYYEN